MKYWFRVYPELNALVAQWIEHLSSEQRVAGSSPAGSTMSWLLFVTQFLLFCIILLLVLYFISMVISDFYDAPYVPTAHRSIERIITGLSISKHDVFFDLGCGDGRTAIYMAKTHKIRSIGIELNPILHSLSLLKKAWYKCSLVQFYRQDILKTDLKTATIIYCFLYPEILNKLSQKLIKECQSNTLIVSHGFKIKRLQKYTVKELTMKPFSTYIYRL